MSARLSLAEAKRLGIAVPPARGKPRARQARPKPQSPEKAERVTHTFVIPDFLPISLNEMLRMKPGHRNRVLKAEAELVAGYFVAARIPHAKTMRRVTLTFAAPGGRGEKVGDADNRLKGLFDALVKCGALVDDSPQWCEWLPPTLERGKKRTVVLLEDVP